MLEKEKNFEILKGMVRGDAILKTNTIFDVRPIEEYKYIYKIISNAYEFCLRFEDDKCLSEKDKKFKVYLMLSTYRSNLKENDKGRGLMNSAIFNILQKHFMFSLDVEPSNEFTLESFETFIRELICITDNLLYSKHDMDRNEHIYIKKYNSKKLDLDVEHLFKKSKKREAIDKFIYVADALLPLVVVGSLALFSYLNSRE